MTRHNEFELMFFNKIKQNVNVLVDVGCRDDIEYFLLRPEAKMYLFDINKRFIDIVNEKLTNHKNINNVKPYNFGLSNKNSTATYSTVSESIHRAWGSPEEVNIKKFDETLKELEIENIDFLKMDIEGSEPEILYYTKILNNIKFIQFEYATTWSHSPLKLKHVMEKFTNHKFYFLKDLRHPISNAESALLTRINDKVLEDIEHYMTKDCGCNIIMIRNDVELKQ